jgi:hypothetical protein
MITQNFDSLIIVNISHDTDNQTRLILEGSGLEPDEDTIKSFILSLRGFLVDFGEYCERLSDGSLRIPINSGLHEVTVEKMDIQGISEDIGASLENLPEDHVKLLHWTVGNWSSLVLLLFRFENLELVEPVKNLVRWGEYKNFVRTERFTKKLMETQDTNNTCSICLEEIKFGRRCAIYPCGHTFHASCSRKWLCKEALHPTCPLCRKDVRITCKSCDTDITTNHDN